jgi:membrane protease YdiL (CAAX protease family)
VRRLKPLRPIIALMVAGLWSWGLAALSVATGEAAAFVAAEGPVPMGFVLYPLGASLGALILAWGPGWRQALGLSLGRLASLKAWAWGLLAGVLCTAIGHLLGQGSTTGANRAMALTGGNAVGLMANPGDVMVMLLGQALLFSLIIGVWLYLAEEILWRGALARSLSSRSAPVRWAVTGLLHGLWSLPLLAAGGLGWPPGAWAGLLLWPLVCVAFAPALEHWRTEADSALGSALARSAFMAMGMASSLTLAGPEAAWAGPFGLSGIVVGAALSGWLTRRRPVSSA